ncbi:PHP domain-containing protein [Thiomicrospira microaerophila]|uniref:PHP domain-containing protein n=1 Tax=Thiomicrospira microaerophila TaxID=406020 RepID=UPI00200C9024|nr:PHP domain-containing protein [Thiomicrospira microaerophila]UQB41325.1 PHP domain-containing protein [Thiomicrospira microaerophila]
MKVDFHCHTNASDGSLSPMAIIDLAVDKQLAMLAITDHDTTAGFEAAFDYALDKGLHLISGVEMSVMWQGRSIHIVGLNVDVNNAALQTFLASIRESRWQRVEMINQKLIKRGHPCLLDRVRQMVGEGVVARPHVADVLIERGYVKDIQQAFDRFLKNGRPAYVAESWPALAEGVKRITEAGGVAVMAHPEKYSMTSRKLNLMLTDFAAAGGKGIEVVTSPYRTSTSVGMADRAKRYGFYASMGSDFHNPNHKWRNLGWLADLPDGVTPIYQAW